MPKKKLLLALTSFFLIMLVGSQFVPLESQLISLKEENVYANELIETNIYLPLIMRQFPPPPPSFGVDFFGWISPQNGITEMVQAGASWTRRNGVVWANVEPNKGDRNWSALTGLETELINAQQNGLEVVLIVRGTPSWAQKYPGVSCGAIKPEELDSFASFIRDLVARYSVPPYSVKYWEIWNEPDISYQLMKSAGLPDSEFGCWGDGNDLYYGGGYYGEMLSKVTPQIKLADPNAKVLVGGLLMDCDPSTNPVCTSTLFLEGILRAGGGAYFDGISFHAYDYYTGVLGGFYNPGWNSSWDTTGPVVIAKAGYIKGLLDNPEFGAPGKFLMNTETAIICGGFNDPPGTPPCDADPNSTFEKTKAYYVAKAFTASQSLGLRASIWYSVFGWRNSGLLNGDLSPRPAYTAYSVAENALNRAFFERKVSEYDGVEGYAFSNAGKLIWVLWSKDGLKHTINLSTAPDSIYDALGLLVTPGNTLDVDLIPMYLEWNN